MDPALIKLMLLQARGLLRRIVRGARTVRGAVFFAFGVGIAVLWLGSVLLSAKMQRQDPEYVRGVLPLILLGICILTTMTSAGDKAVAFTPGEVDLLFPGPFTRRQLLLYKLIKNVFAAALSSLVISIALLRFATLWVACYVGILLSILLIQFFGMALLLLGQAVGERAYGRGRRWVLIAVAAVAALGIWGVMSRYPLAGPGRVDVSEAVQHFARSGAGHVLLAPFKLFAETITAERVFPDLLKWGTQALLVILLLLGVVIKLDANYLEAAAGASQRRYERMRRVRSGAALSATARATARRRLPQPPFLAGAGPIAWRQLTNALRSSRGLLIVLFFLALGMGPFFVAAREPAPSVTPGMHQRPDFPFVGLLSTLVWFSVLLASLLKFDFRSDLDAMETVKTLPLAPAAVAVGQLVAPVLVMTAIHLLLLAGVAYAFHPSADQRAILVVAAVLTVPFNLLMFATENLIFLISPSRPASVGPGDFSILGRQIFTLFLRAVIVMIGAGIAATAGGVAYLIGGRSLAVLTVVTGAVLLAESAALIPALAWAFARFDPSLHTPGQ
jgi:Putative ABC exporter